MTARSSAPRPAVRRPIVVIAHLAEPSGAPRVTLEVARHLKSLGRHVLFVVPGPGPITDDARAAGLDVRVIANAPRAVASSGWLRAPGLLLQRARAVVALAALLWRHHAAAAWVGSTAAWAPLIAPVMVGVPLIVHVHESLGKSRGDRARVKYLRRFAKALVFVADTAKRRFVPRPRRQSWSVVPNPIDPARYTGHLAAAPVAALRRSLHTTDGAIVLLCVAFLSPRKGHDVLLRAVAAARQRGLAITLWCAGAPPADHADWAASLKKLAAELGVADHVRWLGMRDDVPALLAAADALVLASREEAAPLSIAEAMMASRPVIATRVGSVESMVSDGFTGRLVPPGDDAALADAIAEIATDGELARSRGEAGHRRALERYAPARFREGIVAVVDRVAPKASR